MPDKPSKAFILRPLDKADLEVITPWFQDIEDLGRFDRTSRIPFNLEPSPVHSPVGEALEGATFRSLSELAWIFTQTAVVFWAKVGSIDVQKSASVSLAERIFGVFGTGAN